jgi:PIN domain nuclease of toxin-antitoxin system
MKLLLDTHIWIWSLEEPWKLSPDVTKELTEPGNTLYLSPVSIWELSLLLERKRVVLQQNLDLGQWCKLSVQQLALQEAPFTWDVAAELPFTRFLHRDPGDRFLVATAKAFDLTLVTADERMLEVPELKVLANR